MREMTLRAVLAVWGLAAAVVGCGRPPPGVVEIRIPEPGVASLACVRLDRDRAVWVTSNATPVIRATVSAGSYRLTLGFANSNYQPPSELESSRLDVAGGSTQVFACGLLAFDVRDGLPDLNLAAVRVRGADGRSLEQRDAGNTHYFFRPKPLPPGVYDVAIRYSRSDAPSVMATGLVVRAGETTTVALDSGLALRPPAAGGKVVGWRLTREDSSAPWLSVRRGWDNDEPLWRRFMVPPGVYTLSVERDPAVSAPATATVTVAAGQTTVHDL